jgi:hypothetical protein
MSDCVALKVITSLSGDPCDVSRGGKKAAHRQTKTFPFDKLVVYMRYFLYG